MLIVHIPEISNAVEKPFEVCPYKFPVILIVPSPVEELTKAGFPFESTMMDKFPTTVSIKGKPDQTRIIKSQFIFISNETIPSQMCSLERRVSFYNVDHKLYDCVVCLFT